MAKNKLVKNVTIDELAVIINKGFDGQMDYLKGQFGQVNERFNQVDKKFERVDKRLEKVEEEVGLPVSEKVFVIV